MTGNQQSQRPTGGVSWFDWTKASLGLPFRWVLERGFGFDYFISYAWSGSRQYAHALGQALERVGLRCFIDDSREGFVPGGDLRAETERAIRSSTALIVVADEQALKSPYVAAEVRQFAARDALIIPIDVDGTLAAARKDASIAAATGVSEPREEPLQTLLNRLGRAEPLERAAAPSEEVVRHLVEAFKYTRRRTWRIRMAVGTLVIVGVLIATSIVLERTGRRQELRAQLIELLTTPEPDWAGFTALSVQHDYSWNQIPGGLPEDVVQGVDPRIFVALPWQKQGGSYSQSLDVIERIHDLLLASPKLFGAMSYALEEVALRNPSDIQLTERARTLFAQLRHAFIRHHKQQNPKFTEPPGTPEQDGLNVWKKLPGGSFTIGSLDGREDERPPHVVQVLPFAMQQHEVTLREYRRFDPDREFDWSDERQPASDLTWYEASAYAAWLGASLPTEAQWEYAARGTGEDPPAGKKGRPFVWGFELPSEERVRSGFNFQDGTVPRVVGEKGRLGQTPEELDDMGGNVAEWCRDWYGPYTSDHSASALGPQSGEERVVRSVNFWWVPSRNTHRAAERNSQDPKERFSGFRLVSSHLRQ